MQDNPFAKDDLAIITDDYIIPLDTQGTTIFCDTSSPTEVELQQLPRVILTSAIDWDPQKVQFSSHNSDRVVWNTFVQHTSDFVFIRQHMTRSIFPQGLSNKFGLIGQKGNRTQLYDKTYLPPGLPSPENIIWG